MGVANDHSIAWGIARMLAAHGAEIAFTYQGDAQAQTAEAARGKPWLDIFFCPAMSRTMPQLDDVFEDAAAQNGAALDFLVHAIAYSDKNELKGRYVDTTRANFLRSLDISCYSFTAVAQRAARLMSDRYGPSRRLA